MKVWTNLQKGDVITWDGREGIVHCVIGNEYDSDGDKVYYWQTKSWFQRIAEGDSEYGGVVTDVKRKGQSLPYTEK